MRVGDSVVYHSPAGGGYTQPLAAIVTKVHASGEVNLAIFDPLGNLIQNPRTHIGVGHGNTDHHNGWCDGGSVVVADTSYSVAAENVAPAPQDVGMNLPAGAKVVEQRPATAAEVAAAKRSIGVSK